MPQPTPMKDDTTLTPSARRSGRHREQQDLNHLLGFTLPPRAPQPPTHLPRRSTRRNPNHAVFDRARFVHQFRFVVKPDKDYTVHFADPDIHIDWPDVLQVILPTSASALSSVATTKLDQSVAGDSGTSSGVPACPICLSEPVAPRMTKCGHVYCYPCILHYLALGESGNKTRQCPICHDSVHSKDLKSVKWFFPESPVSVPAATSPPASVEPVDAELARALELSRLDAQGGRSSTASEPALSSRERLKMRLIRRPQITTLALPRSATWPSTAVPPLRAPWNFTPDAFTYAKFFLGAPDYLRDELLAQKVQLEAEIQTLRRFGQRGGTDEQLGIVFIDVALRKVDEQLQKVDLLKTTAVMTARKRSLRELHDIQQLRAADGDDRLPPVTDTSASEVEAASDVDTFKSDDACSAIARQPAPAPPVYDPIPLDFLHTRSTPLAAGAPPFTPPTTAPPAVISATLSPPRTRTAQKRSTAPTEQPIDDVAYYFYQAASGQPIFLSPLDIKILKSHFGTYQAMPDNIEVVVEGADEGSMNDELRRRCKWLGHLPVASDVVFIEADLSTVVPKKALAPYTTALRQRRTKRRDKARKEDRAKQRSEQKAAEALPVHKSTYAFGAPGGLPFGFAAASSWDDDHAFPATSTSPASGRSNSPRRAEAPSVANAPTRPSPSLPQAARPSFASAVHASSRSAGGSSSTQSVWDDALEDRWGQLEEEIGRRRAASPRMAAASSVSTPGETTSNGQGKKGKRAKKLTLHLSGSALRGAG